MAESKFFAAGSSESESSDSGDEQPAVSKPATITTKSFMFSDDELALSSTPGMLCLLWLPALAEAIASVPFATESYSQHVEALQGRVTFYWAVDESKQILRAGVAAQTAGWLGVGFNAFPEMTGADIVMMSVDADGNPLAVQDLHATGFSTPVADVTQDVVVNSQGRSNGISWFTFERNLTNCDTQGDYQFVRIGNEFTLLVAVGDSHTWQNHGASNREAIRMRLVETASPALPADVIQLPILAPDATVPTAPGSYVCSLHELPNDREYHLVRFKVKRGTAALVSDGGGSVLHHVDMFSCKHLPGAVNAIVACGVAMAACDEMLLSGGYSGHGENLPPDTGLSIGPSNKYVMINRHFYNAKGQAGIIDSGTGYDIWYTPTLRPNSMGRLSILQGHLDIPAGATGFTSIGYCPQKCTESMWPSSGITVTSVNFHMHSSGRRIRLQVIRAGQEMPDIARLDPFSDAGANVEVNYKLLPGDTLRLHCTYDNPSSAMLKWGEDRYDEMCVVNMLYYPKSELLACADFAKGQTEMFPPSQAFKTMCQTYCQPGQACGKGGVCESINFDDEGCMKCACPLCDNDYSNPVVFCSSTGETKSVFEDPILCPNCLQDKTSEAPKVSDACAGAWGNATGTGTGGGSSTASPSSSASSTAPANTNSGSILDSAGPQLRLASLCCLWSLLWIVEALKP